MTPINTCTQHEFRLNKISFNSLSLFHMVQNKEVTFEQFVKLWQSVNDLIVEVRDLVSILREDFTDVTDEEEEGPESQGSA